MDKLTSIRIKYNDGTYLDQIPIGVLVQNVGYDSSHNLLQVLGTIDVDSNGTIQAQINKLFNEKVNSSDLDDYVNNQISTNVTQWLVNNVTPTGSVVMVDQSLSISGAAADAKAVGNLKSALNNTDIILDYQQKTINYIANAQTLYMPGVDQSGKVINYSGTVVDAGSSFHVITNDVLAGEAFLVTASSVNGGYWYIFTDGINTIKMSEKCLIGGDTITDKLVITPDGATKLVISYNPTYISGKVKKIIGYEISGLSELDSRIDEVESIMIDIQETINVPISDLILHNNHYMFTRGGESGESTAWQYFEYSIPSEATSLIVTASAGQSARLWILKDANNTVIDYSDDSSTPTVKTETVNLVEYQGATKLFVNDKKSGEIRVQYTSTAKKVNGDDVYWSSAPNRLWGKTLCCCGDSITYGADMDAEGITDESNIEVYQSDSAGNFIKKESGFLKTWNWQIASRNKMTLYNAGVSGSTMQGEGGVNGFSLANGRYTKLPENIDYLLIWFGWNDNAYGTLGQISDNTNASYYGGYNVVLPYLINKYPYAKIGLIVPFGSSAGHREAIRLLGNKWGCAVWDNYQGGTPLYFGKEDSVGVSPTIVTANKAKFQANGAHPNFKGHRQLADMIEEWMKGI